MSANLIVEVMGGAVRRFGRKLPDQQTGKGTLLPEGEHVITVEDGPGIVLRLEGKDEAAVSFRLDDDSDHRAMLDLWCDGLTEWMGEVIPEHRDDPMMVGLAGRNKLTLRQGGELFKGE